MYQQIPFTIDPNQEFEVSLNINDENRNFKFYVTYNRIAGYWIIKIVDSATGEILLDSVPLLMGGNITSDILLSYSYLEIGEAYLSYITENASSDSPNETNLETEFGLVWDDNI